MSDNDRIKNTIYQFKTGHGEASPEWGMTFNKYEEISTPEKTYYTYSNDNEVYTEISAPGFEEKNNAYNVFFVGEYPPLDNALAYGNFERLNTPRNIAFVKVSTD